MLRIIQYRSAEQLKAYHEDALSVKSDYFINDQELPGRFYGRIAERLGIAGETTQQVFDDLCENVHPLTGEPLTPRTVDNRTVAYSLDFHCPKSVSAANVLRGDDAIVDAFHQSVYETMRDIEADACVRVRKNGQDSNRPTGELLWGQFLHLTARPVDGSFSDPHLHAHCVTFNVSYDPVEDCYKAGQFQQIKQDAPFYQSRFHVRLAARLLDMGYPVQRTRTAFEIEGMDELIALFSKRTNAIGQFIQDNHITGAKQKDKVGEWTRNKKRKDLSMAELTKDWLRQMHALVGKDNLEKFADTCAANDKITDTITPPATVDFALAQQFERASVVPGRRLLEAAYRQALGKTGATLEAITAHFQADKRIIQVNDGSRLLCTTRQVLAEERRLVALVHKGRGKLPPLYKVLPELSLTGQQATAAAHVLTATDRVTVIAGRAGTGKTTMMRETVHCIEATGMVVTVVAPTSSAARLTLRAEGFAEAETVAKLLATPSMHERLKNGVLWVDEGGLLGTRDALAVLELATKYNTRIIISGDPLQHTAVDRGDALRILTTVAGVRPAQISKIYRQQRKEYREAVQALSDGNIQTGFDKLEMLGAIHDLDPTKPYEALAAAYVATLQRKKTALVICPTHAQGAEVTHAIREKLREAGLLGEKETPCLSLVNLSMTDADKSDARNYAPGYVLHYRQNRPGIKRGSRWTVVSVKSNELLLKDERARILQFPLTKTDDFEVYRQTEIALAKNDLIRISRNGTDSNDKRLNNGQLLKVQRVDASGRLTCRSLAGKARYTLAADFGHLAYAHCLTSHRSQGQTVDVCFVAQPESSFGAASLKQFYVSVSRAREEVQVYTDNRAGLLQQVGATGDRVSALELLKQRSRTSLPTVLIPVLRRPPDAVPPPPLPTAPAIVPMPTRIHAPKLIP